MYTLSNAVKLVPVKKPKPIVFYALSFVLGILFLLLVDFTGKKTSTSEYCISCHAHP
ncbi:MAG: NapC/NirT family cytochrome c, partial [Prolixibacteraceae bacterium]|nr:NapC/NirT family cytochrome c [Prolixibacteraceae bacterium]